MKTNFLKHLTALVFLFCMTVSARANVTYVWEDDYLLHIKGNATDDDLSQEYVANTIIPNATYRNIYKIVIEGIRKVEDDAFSSFEGVNYQNRKAFVTHITVNNVGEVGSNSFSNFTGLEQLVIQGTTTCNLKYDSFKDCRIKNINVECPITTTIKNGNSSEKRTWRGAFSDLKTVDCIKFDCPTVPTALCYNTEIKNVVFTATVKNVIDVFGKDLGDYLVRPSFETVTFEETSESISLVDFDCHSVQNFVIARPFSGLDDSLETGAFTIGGNFKFNDISFSTGYNLNHEIRNVIVDNPSFFSNDNGFTAAKNVAYKFPVLKTLVLGENVTEIGDYAFYGCNWLKSVDIQNENITIGENAFPIKEDMTYDEWVAFYHSNCAVLYIPNDAIANKGDYTADQNLNTLYPNVKKVVFGPNVTTIGDNIFKGKNNIETVEFNSLVTVGESAFSLNKNLQNLTADKITNCSEFCFYGCSSLTSLDLTNCKTIAKGAFAVCSALTEVKVYPALESVSEGAFTNYGYVKTLYINSPSFLSKSFEQGKTAATLFGLSLTKIIIGDDVQTIGSKAFAGYRDNTQLTTLVIGSGVSTIADDAFTGNILLKNVTINSKSLAAKDYDEQTSLPNIFAFIEDLTFGPDVTSVGESLFDACKTHQTGSGYPLQKVTFLSDQPIAVGELAFCTCRQLNTIAGKIKSVSGWSFTYTDLSQIKILDDTGIEYGAFEGCSNLAEVYLPANLETIGTNAFSGCKKLNRVNMTSVATIGKNAFKDCSGLEWIEFPENLTTIDVTAFAGCKALNTVVINGNALANANWSLTDNLFDRFPTIKNLTFGQEVTTVGDYAFYSTNAENNQLEEIYLYSTPAIGAYAFYGCKALTKIGGEGKVKSVGEYSFAYTKISKINITNDTEIEASAFEGCNCLEEAYLPSNLETIGVEAFTGCSMLNRVNMPSVVTIDEDAFANCTSLEWIELPANLTTVDVTAFNGCTNLKTVSINGDAFANANWTKDDNIHDRFPYADYFEFGSAVTAVHDYAFYVAEDEASPLRRLNFHFAASIGTEAFGNNRNLTQLDGGVGSVAFAAFVNCSQLTSILISKGTIDMNAFKNCSSLKSVTLPEDLTAISLNAFFGCSSLEQIEIPSSVTSIEPLAFYNCTSLAEVEIPVGVTKIGNSAFYGCSNLYKVICNVAIPIDITGRNVFSGVPVSEAELLVPYESLEAYKAADVWKDFFKIIASESVMLQDGEAYTNQYDQEVPMIRYTRTFAESSTNRWQALCVPFAIDVEDYKEQFDIAELYAFCPMQDTNGDDEIDSDDEHFMIVQKVKKGQTIPNMPYVIRPKAAGEYVIESTSPLAAAEEKSITFSTTRKDFTITGILTGNVVADTENQYHYVSETGNISHRTTGSTTIKPNRWYMTVEDHGYGSTDIDNSASRADMRIVALGEDLDEATAIRLVEGDYSVLAGKTHGIYTLDGIKVTDTNHLPAGLYVKDGQKVYLK